MIAKYLNKRSVLILLFSLLLVYILLRADALSFVHDESITYKSVQAIQSILENDPLLLVYDKTFIYDVLWLFDANNHLLNTGMILASSYILGESELAIRFPNILAFIAYLFCCYIILKRAKNLWLMFIGFSLLLLNPYLLEFFGAARGYGLSVGLLFCSLHFFMRKKLHEHTYRSFLGDFVFTMIFATLAMFANLSLVIFYIALLGCFTLQYLFYVSKTDNYPKFIFVFLSSCGPLLLIIIWLLVLNSTKRLYVGFPSFAGTIDSLFKLSYYFTHSNLVSMLTFYSIIVSFIAGVVFVIFKKRFDGKLFKIIVLLFLLFLGFSLLHILFGSKFPPARTAIFLIPMFGLFLYYFIVDVYMTIQQNRRKIFSITLFFLFVIPITSNFSQSMNLRYSRQGLPDEQTKDVMMAIKEDLIKTVQRKKKIKVSPYWIFTPAMNFYRSTHKMDSLQIIDRNFDINADYVYTYLINDSNQTVKVLFKKIKYSEDVSSFEKMIEFPSTLKLSEEQIKTSTAIKKIIDNGNKYLNSSASKKDNHKLTK